ncbi:MAG: DUF1015 family protein [Zoogloeaceae bacterium]|jgi:uncharacterized protein (DUF1015 family)|nr:DUF1015 family protein [Zoogloeaceae bacterium]
MSLIQPFPGLRPAPGRAAEVAAPPYDVLSTEEARRMVYDGAGKPNSFLHISKAEIDLPPETDPYSPPVYAKSRQNFDRMLREGVLKRDDAPCYYAYRLMMGGHSQLGLVAAASVAAYESNRIRKHEFTRPDKEDDRVHQIEALDAQTGPVLLAHPDAPEVDALLAQAAAGQPDADLTAIDGIRHTLWPIRDAAVLRQLTAAFDAMPALYIADGHHRSAAAARVAAARRAKNPPRTADAGAAWEYFLTVIFPRRQMRIMDYNRVVKDLNGLSREDFLARLSERFGVSRTTRAKPSRHGEFSLYLPGQWYRLIIHPRHIPSRDPVARLDVSLLSDNLLGPILDIHDLRRDKRIAFVGGIRGLEELERRVDSGEMAAAFALHATGMDDLMAVADAGEVMPPKSTWFEPKLADGLVSHVLD